MVKLALLWHMHQPNYEDLATGEHILPWVRLHAIKDYWGMVAMLEAFPEVRVTFNLVPSLVTQVQAFAEDRARDRHLALGLAPAAALTADEAAWVMANGFHAPYGRMIAPYPRYAQLHAMREERRPFAADDLRDLQVWHKLAWMDPDLLLQDPRLVALVEKGSHYSEDDKALLRTVELDLLRRVVPAYQAAADRGQVELSTSPFYHPILPLLCDSDVHLRAHPSAARPRVRFRRPEDARAQIDRALAFHETVFGHRPHGLWPSEGSVSDEALALVAEAGLAWAATDEDILSRTLGVPFPRDGYGHAERADLLYRPYRAGGAGPVLFFRDHALSDRIGFTYQSWDADAAAADFVGRVREAGRRFSAQTGGAEATVSVILDGENAWEHYAGGGRPFLRALYGRLAEAADIRCVTMSEAATAPSTRLDSVFPGSWINADFYIWIGHRDDQRAWTQLGEARAAYDTRSAGVSAEARARAFEELLIAEGSDWFWWYGDDHSSDHDRDFDDLFRRHLRNAYVALGLAVPDELFVSNITTAAPGPSDALTFGGLVAPILDGDETSALEWVGAARPAIAPAAGAMHEVSATSLLSEVVIGVGASSLFLRLRGDGFAARIESGSLRLSLIVSEPAVVRVDLERRHMAAGRLVEAGIGFDELGAGPGDQLRFAILVCDPSGAAVASVPASGSWTFVVPGGLASPVGWAV